MRAPGRVQLQSISTDSEHDAPSSGQTESTNVTLLAYTLGGGPIANTHIAYIHISPKLHDLYANALSGREDGEPLSSDSDRAMCVRPHGARVLEN